MNKKIPSTLILLGVLIALFFLFADALGIGKAGIQAAQIFGVEIGVLIVLAGLALNTLQKKNEFPLKTFWLNLRDGFQNLPALTWVIVGALLAFVLFFIVPSFFDPSFRIQYPAEYIRQLVPIGFDFQTTLRAVEVWLKDRQVTPYVFTPLEHLLLAPVLLLKYPTSYHFIVFVTLSAYLTLSLVAALISADENKNTTIFIAAVSIFSYGFVFELERGQTHTLALALCVLAIYIFHYHRDFRFLAYLLFCVSVQIKLYPALFVILFVDDWRDWKNTLTRFVSLGLANFLLLFLFGFSFFSAFYDSTINSVQSGEPAIVNHSIQSFVYMLSSSEWNLFNGATALWIERNGALLRNLLYAYFLVCFLIVLVNAWIKNKRGFNADLLLVCVVGSLVLPSINHDYSLPLLMAPTALSIASWHTRDFPSPKALTIILTTLVSFAYFATLFPPLFRPLYLQNSLPMIFVILTAVALQNMVVAWRGFTT